MRQVELIICDFDGTLVDTFDANYYAYERAFSEVGLSLSKDEYNNYFGLRFDDFMKSAGVPEGNTAIKIKELKSVYYPQYFACLKVNKVLLDFVRAFHLQGGKTAIASTARGENLRNALEYIGATSVFDMILTGESVSIGKPSPEIYHAVLNSFEVKPECALVFEDSQAGCQAAERAGIRYIQIGKAFYGN